MNELDQLEEFKRKLEKSLTERVEAHLKKHMNIGDPATCSVAFWQNGFYVCISKNKCKAFFKLIKGGIHKDRLYEHIGFTENQLNLIKKILMEVWV